MELAKKIAYMNQIIKHLKETNLENTVPFILMGHNNYPDNSETEIEYKEIQAELLVKHLVKKTGNSLNGFIYFFLEDKAYTITDVKELFHTQILAQSMLENAALDINLKQHSPTTSKPNLRNVPSILDDIKLQTNLYKAKVQEEEKKKKKRESISYQLTIILGIIGIISFVILVADSGSVKGLALQIIQYFTSK
jgi:hypothetical protein